LIIKHLFDKIASLFIKLLFNNKHKSTMRFNTPTFSLAMLVILFVCTTVFAQVAPDEALKRLQDGNKRFTEGKSNHPRQDISRIKEVAKGQKPFAIIVGCSDSRVPNEIIFDQGLGDLFIVRTAGQVSAAASFGSIEFAEEVLGAKLIVVLGHTKCGAVAAACNYEKEVPGNIIALVNAIKPAALRVKAMNLPADQTVEATVRENVIEEVNQLRNLEPLLAKRIRENSIKIVGGVYDLETGKVNFVPETLK
jgi:carbonic anhydrase